MTQTTSRTRRIIRADEDRRDREGRLATPDEIDVRRGSQSYFGNIASMNFGHSDVANGSIEITFEINGTVSIKHLLTDYANGVTLSNCKYNTSEGVRASGERNGKLSRTELMQQAIPNAEDLEDAFRQVSGLPVSTEHIALARRAVTQVQTGTFETIPNISIAPVSL